MFKLLNWTPMESLTYITYQRPLGPPRWWRRWRRAGPAASASSIISTPCSPCTNSASGVRGIIPRPGALFSASASVSGSACERADCRADDQLSGSEMVNSHHRTSFRPRRGCPLPQHWEIPAQVVPLLQDQDVAVILGVVELRTRVGRKAPEHGRRSWPHPRGRHGRSRRDCSRDRSPQEYSQGLVDRPAQFWWEMDVVNFE